MKRIKYYLKLLSVFARFSLMAQLEYRINFISSLLVEMGYLCVKLTYVAVVYGAGVSIGGMTPDQIVIFIGSYVMMTGMYMCFAPSFYAIPDYVREGQLDMLITKPLSLQFIMTLRRLDFGMPIPNITGGLILVCIGWSRAGLAVSFTHIAGFILFTVTGVFLTYCLFLIPKLLSFWFVSTNGISQMTDALWDFNNMPMNIYSDWIQKIGTFLLPIFIITNFPGLIAMDRLKPGYIAWGLIVPVLAFLLSRAVLKSAVKRYTSASS